MTQEIIIPYKPRYPQTVIHPELEKHRFSVLVAHRRLGKSVMAINHTIKKAIQNPLIEPRYGYIGPFLKQVKLIAWSYLKRYTAPIPGVKTNESELFVQLPNGAKIWLFGADNPDAMRGTYFDGVVMDEFGQFRNEVWGEIIRPSLVDRNGWGLFSGTPKGQNQFLEILELAQRLQAQGDPNWWSGIFRADETGVIPEDELNMLRQVVSDSQFRQEFLCDFTASADNVLIPIDLVSEAVKRVYRQEDINGAPKIIGVDPSRFGDDRKVIVRRQGLVTFPPKIIRQKMDTMDFAAIVAQEINEFQPDATFIDVGGPGAGVVDRLRQLGFYVSEVNFGGQALNPNQYVNKRTEMWDTAREHLEQGGSIPNDPEFKSDLVVATYSYDAANRMKLEPKESIKERLGKSPDIGDAWVLTFAFPVQAKRGYYNQNSFATANYDVLGNTPGNNQNFAKGQDYNPLD